MSTVAMTPDLAGNPTTDIASMSYPMRCLRCRTVHDAGRVETAQRFTDCTTWRCPNCDALLDDRPISLGGSAEKVEKRIPTAPVPTVQMVPPPPAGANAAQHDEHRRRQLAAVATRHGMTVQQWLDHCDRTEDAERGHRDIASLMRQTPRYREGNAA